MRYVPGQGNPNARLMVVGEAPGADEEREGIPFIGASGRIVDDCLETGGMDRSEVYVTNVVKIRPPNNEIYRLPELGTKIDDFLPQLWKEIDEINPNCILALGNVALKALTGETGIKDYRGSILPNCRSILPKVVASIHPASLFHTNDGSMMSYRDRAFIQFDVNRAIKQSEFKEYRPPSRNLIIARNSRDLYSFWDRHVSRGFRRFATDIETSKTIPMCISFAFTAHEAISVPLLDYARPENPDGMPLHDLAIIWKWISEWLLDPQYQIIGQNLKFDQGRLEEIGVDMRWPWFDTSIAWHTLYSELPKKLAFIASIITEEPYYKDELEEYNPRRDKLDKRLKYNAKDSAVEFEVYEKEAELLKQFKLEDFFFSKMMPLHKFYYNMEKRGFKVDLVERKRLIKKYERYTKLIHHQVAKDLGYELNVMSPKQVGTTMWGDLKLPHRKDTGEDTIEALCNNVVKDERKKRILRNILKERKSRKTLGTYVKSKLSGDGRGRTVYNITGTESGRTSTSKPKAPVVVEPMGFAFQTLTKHGDVGADLRKMFIPDEGYVLIEADGSQAEARVVSILAHDNAAMEMMNRTNFKKNKYGIKDDIHTWTTQLVTGAAFEEIDDEQRQLGKKTRHAGNYGMGKKRLAQMAQISEYRAGKCLDRFHEENPNISGVFWEEVKQALQDSDKCLWTPHGRFRQFFDRWGDDLFKEAYAHIPQATVSDHTKFAAIRVEEACPWFLIIQESHDSFLGLCPINRVDELNVVIKKEMEVPIDFSKCSIPRGMLVIPCEIHVGRKNWKEMVKC